MSEPIFQLPPRLAAKADPSLIGADEAHLSRVAATLDAMPPQPADSFDALLDADARARAQARTRIAGLAA